MSAQTAAVVAEAQRFSELSNGAFDITVGPLVDLWGFGPDPRTGLVPEEPALEAAARRVGYRHLEVRDHPPGLRKAIPGLGIDLSAIAKGYAVDRIAALLLSLDISDFMVEIGGEVRVSGRKPDGSFWRIGIETPRAGPRDVHRIVELDGVAMATSGDYRNYFEQDGKRYSHTIDPKTGKPIEHRLASITIIDESAMFADAMATAMMVLGPEAGMDLGERLELAALFVVKRETGFESLATSRFLAEYGD